MTTIKDLLDERARAMALHDEDSYSPIYIVGAANAIIADVLNARDDLLTGAPAAGAEVAPNPPAAKASEGAPLPTPEPTPESAAEPGPAEQPAADDQAAEIAAPNKDKA